MANLKQIKVGNTTYNIEPYTSYYKVGRPDFEMNSDGSLKGYGGFIDFHFFNSSGQPLNSSGSVVSSTPDYTSRIIEDSAGCLDINGTYIAWTGLTSGYIKSNGSIDATTFNENGTSLADKYVTIGTAQTISGLKTFKGNESNDISFVYNGNKTISGYGNHTAIRHALSFPWYNDIYQIGNIRGDSSDSLGFGITKSNNTIVARFVDTSNAYIGNNTIIHSGNIGSQNVNYATSAGNADTLDGKHSSDFYLSSSNITNLPINGGIYWNSYVESSSDGSDAASITVIRDGNGSGGTVLQIKQANDANDIVNVVAGDLRLNGTSVSISGHDHDNRYYTESEVNSKLDGKSNTGHTHDDRYYTESEINTKLNGKSDTGHTHTNLKSNTDNRNSNTTPNDYNGVLNIAGLKGNDKIGLDTNTYGTYSCLIGVRGWQDSSGGDSHEIALTGNGQLMHRHGSTTSWGSWDEIAHASYVNTQLDNVRNSISGLGSALNNKADKGHTHSYLPLGGGAITGTLNLQNSSAGISFTRDWYITNIETGSVQINIGTAAVGYTTSITATFKNYNKGLGTWYVVATVRGASPAQPECVVAGIGDVDSNGIKIRVRKIANNSGGGSPTWYVHYIAIKYH